VVYLHFDTFGFTATAHHASPAVPLFGGELHFLRKVLHRTGRYCVWIKSIHALRDLYQYSNICKSSNRSIWVITRLS
jgi:hypothetical protein